MIPFGRAGSVTLTSVFDRKTLTARPPDGDYILRTTGFSWSVRRSHGTGAAQSISEGDRDRGTALAKLLLLAEADRTDAWETVGNLVFWRLKRFRAADDPHTSQGPVAT